MNHILIIPMSNTCSICSQLEQYIIDTQESVETYRQNTIQDAIRLIEFIEDHPSSNDFVELEDLQMN